MANEFLATIRLMQIVIFGLGAGTFLLGVAVMATTAWGADWQTLATQSNRLAQKGLIDGLSGLVGNANVMLENLNELVRTRRGAGLALMLVGGLLMFGSCSVLLAQLGQYGLLVE